MLKILMAADPFGFGPTGSLMNSRRNLVTLDAQFRFVGHSHVENIVDKKLFERCTFLESFDNYEQIVKDEVQWADLIWSSTEFRILKIVSELKKYAIVYDPLFWFWPTLPVKNMENLTYLCQNFPGVSERINALPSNLKRFFLLVPPMDPFTDKTIFLSDPNNNYLLVNLCGFFNPIKTLDGYAELILETISNVIDKTNWERVLIVGNPKILDSIKIRHKKFTYCSLEYSQMMLEMKSAGLILSCPGLNSTMEAISLGTPICFLPPQNFSQARQLNQFALSALVNVNLDWSNITGIDFDFNQPDEEMAISQIHQMMNYPIFQC